MEIDSVYIVAHANSSASASSFLVAKDRGMWFCVVYVCVNEALFEVNAYATKTACKQSFDQQIAIRSGWCRYIRSLALNVRTVRSAA